MKGEWSTIYTAVGIGWTEAKRPSRFNISIYFPTADGSRDILTLSQGQTQVEIPFSSISERMTPIKRLKIMTFVSRNEIWNMTEDSLAVIRCVLLFRAVTPLRARRVSGYPGFKFQSSISIHFVSKVDCFNFKLFLNLATIMCFNLNQNTSVLAGIYRSKLVSRLRATMNRKGRKEERVAMTTTTPSIHVGPREEIIR
jgi:hypothetical protein